MKTRRYAFFGCLFVLSAFARSGIDVKHDVHVVDGQNVPIPDAQIIVGLEALQDEKDAWKGQKEFVEKGVSDRKGNWSGIGRTLGRSTVSVKKNGYYSSGVAFQLGFKEMQPSGEPVVKHATVILRKIMNPIPMYAWGLYKQAYPVKETEWVGYDMLQAEWMPPHGKGLTEDVQICVVCNIGKRDYQKVPLSVVSIRFLGKHNGVTGIPDQSVCGQSWLQLPYSAPRDGYMTQEFITSHFETLEGDVERHVMNTGTTNCFFRIRSRVDKDGRFIEGLYGKLPGLVTIGNGGPHNISLDLKYYVNPTPNDLNMEWDPKCNLVPKKEAYKVLVFP
jgi:hypothetical protein